MGQAKRRGTYEERVENAEIAQQIIDKAFPNDPNIRDSILHSKFGGDKRAFANEIVARQMGSNGLDQTSKISDNSDD